MANPPPGRPRVVTFGVFEADLSSGELRKQGRRVHLQVQPFALLEALITNPGHVVTREDLRVRLWPGEVTVDFDHSLNKAVNKLRTALGDVAESPRYIETLPKRGYRFIAPVQRLDDVPTSPVASGHSLAASTAEPDADVRAPRRAAGEGREVPVSGMGKGASARRSGRSIITLVGLSLLAAAGTSLYFVRRPPESAAVAPRSGKVTMAVLPFRNLSDATDQEYFSDGLTEELIAQLGRVAPTRLGVIATTSAQRYKSSTQPLDQIGRELGAAYLLEGSVRRTGARVRIAARLIHAADQVQVWSEQFDRSFSDIFDIQSDVSRQVTRALAIELLPSQARPTRPPTTSTEAHEAYLRGRALYATRTREGLLASIEQFERAIGVDPEYARGYVGLADSYNLLAEYGNLAPGAALPKSRAAATRALALDPDLAEAHANLGWTHAMSRELVQADQRLSRAIALNPGYMSAYQWRAGVLRALQRGEEADADIRRAQELDPVSPIIESVAGWHHYLAGRPQEAVAQCLSVIAHNPTFPRVYSYLGWAYLETNEAEKGVAALRRAAELFGDSAARRAELAYGLAVAGERAEAGRLLKGLVDAATKEYVEADLLARVYVALGDHDNAFRWLDRALKEQAVKLLLLGHDPAYAPIRRDPRFSVLMRQAGLT